VSTWRGGAKSMGAAAEVLGGDRPLSMALVSRRLRQWGATASAAAVVGIRGRMYTRFIISERRKSPRASTCAALGKRPSPFYQISKSLGGFGSAFAAPCALVQSPRADEGGRGEDSYACDARCRCKSQSQAAQPRRSHVQERKCNPADALYHTEGVGSLAPPIASLSFMT
jgi:hypothetical protein